MYGGSRYGAGRYGGTPVVTAVPAPPDPPPVLPWDPDASTPVDPPPATPTVPEAQLELIERDGTHVAWLDKALDFAWRRDSRTAGSVAVSLLRSSPLAAELSAPRLLRVWFRGVVVQDAKIGPNQERTYQQGEEPAQTISVSAPGHLAVTDEGVVGPHEVSSLPSGDTQRFNFAHPAYQPDSSWVPATVLARQDATTPHWSTLPAKWTANTAYWIAGAADTTDDADPGVLYAIRDRTVPGQTHQLDYTADDGCEFFVDAIRQGETIDFHGFESVPLRFSEGKHRFASRWSNINQELTNPTGLLMALRVLDGAGRAGDPSVVTDGSWLLLNRPSTPPGWTPGQIVNYVLDRWEVRGGPIVYRGFTDLVDSAGAAWPVIPDWSVPAKASVEEMLLSLAETYVDVSMRPGSFTLDMWVKGTRGTARTEQLGSGYDGVVTPCLLSLEHEVQAPFATRIFARWADSWIDRATTVPGHYVEKTLELPNMLTEAQAVATVDRLLATFGRERVQYRATLHPRTDAQRPHIGFHEGDTIPLPNPEGVFTDVEVISIAGKKVDGRVEFQIEAGDVLFDQEERVHAWLRQMAGGAFEGSTRQATSVRIERIPQTSTPTLEPMRFHRPVNTEQVESDPDTATATGRIVEWTVTLKATRGSATAVDMYINGAPTSPATTCTVPAGSYSASTFVNIPVTKGVERISGRCTATGFAFVAKAVFA